MSGAGDWASTKRFRRGIQRYLPWIFLLGPLWLLVTVIAHGSVEIAWALVLIGAGLPVYLGIRAKRRGR